MIRFYRLMSPSSHYQGKIIIKKASIQHLDSLVNCWLKMANQSYSTHISKLSSPQKIYQLILNNQNLGFFLRAYQQKDGVESLMGVIGIVYSHPASKRWWTISAYVPPQYRKFKISQKLFNKGCEIAKTAGAHDMLFYTNHKAKILYGIAHNTEQLLIDIPLSTQQQYENTLSLSGYKNIAEKYRIEKDLSGLEEQSKTKQMLKIYHRATSQNQQRIYCYEKDKLIGFCQYEVVLYAFAGRVALITALYIDKKYKPLYNNNLKLSNGSFSEKQSNLVGNLGLEKSDSSLNIMNSNRFRNIFEILQIRLQIFSLLEPVFDSNLINLQNAYNKCQNKYFIILFYVYSRPSDTDISIFMCVFWNQGQQLRSTPAPQRVVSPLYCFKLGRDHPPKALQSEKLGLPSQ